MMQYQHLYFLLNLWYSNEFYMDLKGISYRTEWSLFLAHSPKYILAIIFILAISFLSQSYYSGTLASKDLSTIIYNDITWTMRSLRIATITLYHYNIIVK